MVGDGCRAECSKTETGLDASDLDSFLGPHLLTQGSMTVDKSRRLNSSMDNCASRESMRQEWVNNLSASPPAALTSRLSSTSVYIVANENYLIVPSTEDINFHVQ